MGFISIQLGAEIVAFSSSLECEALSSMSMMVTELSRILSKYCQSFEMYSLESVSNLIVVKKYF